MNNISELMPSLSLTGATISIFVILIITYFVTKKSLNFNKGSKIPDVMIAIASGIMITVLFLHLLREVYESNSDGPISAVIISLFLFFILSLLNHSHSHNDQEKNDEEMNVKNSVASGIRHQGGKLLFLGAQSIHSIADGIVIISGWLASPLTGILTSSAIALHHIPMMMGISNKYKTVYSKKFISFYIIYTSIAMLVGIFFAKFVYSFVSKEYFIAIAAASFAHIAILDMFGHVRESHSLSKSSKLLLILLGIALAYISEMSHPH